jgi:hypothetical protein
MSDPQDHWDAVWSSKQDAELSWTQTSPPR